MDIIRYISKVKEETDNIFSQSIKRKDELGKAHHLSSCVFEFAENVNDIGEKKILVAVSSQLETATLNATYGLYRQAFSSLRLALEMGLGAAYFSIYKLELQEWLIGKADIKWHQLIDENNGVLSERFSNAFFMEFSTDMPKYRTKASMVYRELSEYVHGNNETWSLDGIALNYNNDLLTNFFVKNSTISEIIIYVLSCRYLKSFPPEKVDSLEFIREEMNHISYIREYFGGQR